MARVNHKQIKKLIAQKVKTVRDRQLFTSPRNGGASGRYGGCANPAVSFFPPGTGENHMGT